MPYDEERGGGERVAEKQVTQTADIVSMDAEIKKRQPRPVPEDAPSVGVALKDAREDKGVSIADAARELKIRETHLESIEAGDYAALPGRAFAIGFIKAYAKHLGFEPEAAVKRVRGEAGWDAMEAAAAKPIEAEPLAENRDARSMWPIVVVLVFVLWCGWQITKPNGEPGTVDLAGFPEPAARPPEPEAPADDGLRPEIIEARSTEVSVVRGGASESVARTRRSDDAAGDLVQEPDQLRAEPAVEAAADAPEAAGDPPPASAATPSSEPVIERAALPDVRDEPTPERPAQRVEERPTADLDAGRRNEPEPAARPEDDDPLSDLIEERARAEEREPVAATPANRRLGAPPPLPNGRNLGAPPSTSRVVVRAIIPGFLRIEDAAGRVVFAEQVQTGDRYHLPAGSDYRLTALNGGGFDLVVDGGYAGAAGAPGQVVRGKRLEPSAIGN
ncbi:MAG: helix-turn-helix domain-containing protein [Pseudomonadota bacterium]